MAPVRVVRKVTAKQTRHNGSSVAPGCLHDRNYKFPICLIFFRLSRSGSNWPKDGTIARIIEHIIRVFHWLENRIGHWLENRIGIFAQEYG